MIPEVKKEIITLADGRTISIETGKLAKQADGSVVVQMGNAMLLATVVANKEAGEGVDFLPLTGIPLPFISQGGSAIISNLIGVGLLLSMSYQTNLAEEKSGKVPFKRKKVVLKQIK